MAMGTVIFLQVSTSSSFFTCAVSTVSRQNRSATGASLPPPNSSSNARKGHGFSILHSGVQRGCQSCTQTRLLQTFHDFASCVNKPRLYHVETCTDKAIRSTVNITIKAYACLPLHPKREFPQTAGEPHPRLSLHFFIKKQECLHFRCSVEERSTHFGALHVGPTRLDLHVSRLCQPKYLSSVSVLWQPSLHTSHYFGGQVSVDHGLEQMAELPRVYSLHTKAISLYSYSKNISNDRKLDRV